MTENLLQDDVGSMLTTVFGATDEPVYVVNPSRRSISELVSTLDADSDAPEVRLLADERALKDVMDDFLVASTAADLIDEERLTMRLLDDVPNHSVAVTVDTVYALVTISDTVGGLGTDDAQFVDNAYDYYDSAWADADEYSLRTPPLSRVRSTLAAEISEDARADFDAVLDSLSTARSDDGGIDEVTISLLVAARNRELLYDISKWGEDVGLASKATFSRTKTQLEDKGLLDTEKVPIDVGRPRLRLLLGEQRLQDADADELADVAIELLSS
mgnify:CR=1 FL=1